MKDSEYDNLKKHVNSGSCVAFVGSGLSLPDILYPSWEQLIVLLCKECGLDESINLNDSELLLELADKARERDEATYYKTLNEVFGKPVVKTNLAYDLMMRIKFCSYITTNFDPLLEKEAQKPEHHCNSEIYSCPALPFDKIRLRSVYYIHGKIQANSMQGPMQIILGKRDFDYYYALQHGTLLSFLHQLLTSYPLLFIGCGLRERPLRRIFDICREARREIENAVSGSKAPHRYALLPMKFTKTLQNPIWKRDVTKEEEEKARFMELDIRVVRYDPKDENHSGLLAILEEWCTLSPTTRGSGFEGGGLIESSSIF